jgi:hypothetical protein
MTHLGTNEFGAIKTSEREHWGLLQSLRIFYTDGSEIEFGIAVPEWANTKPVDEGTRQVVNDGMQVIYDPKGILAVLSDAVRKKEN